MAKGFTPSPPSNDQTGIASAVPVFAQPSQSPARQRDAPANGVFRKPPRSPGNARLALELARDRATCRLRSEA